MPHNLWTVCSCQCSYVFFPQGFLVSASIVFVDVRKSRILCVTSGKLALQIQLGYYSVSASNLTNKRRRIFHILYHLLIRLREIMQSVVSPVRSGPDLNQTPSKYRPFQSLFCTDIAYSSPNHCIFPPLDSFSICITLRRSRQEEAVCA